MGARRVPSAFVLALGVHAGAALALRAFVPLRPRVVAVAPSTPAAELIVVTEEAPPLAPAPAPSPGAEAPASPRVRVAVKRAASANVGEPGADRASADSTADVTPAPRADPSADPSAGPVDLAIGEYWKQIAMTPGAPASEPPPAPSSAPAPGRILLDMLEASDQERGLGRGGPLASAAHEAATLPVAPDTGVATLVVEADADGKVIGAKVASASADVGAWRDVASELVRLMESKRLHLPPGAHGYRAVLRITAERTLPAGEKRSVSPGAVPEGACIGEGITRKCPEHGLPLGASGTWGDLSNFGQKRVHVVHARVVAETTF